MLFEALKQYTIAWLKSADKQLGKIPKHDRLKIINHIDDINKNPEALDLKKLQGHQDLYRLRVGDYRIIFQLNKTKKLIIISYVGHRREIYDFLK